MDLEKLRHRVEWSTRIAFIIFALVILAYVGKLWFLSGGMLADEPEIWGQFGDYVGGFLNPLIAFLAFYWLTQSVLLQKQELAETKDALRDSADSQSRQALLAAKTAEINALSAVLSTCNSDLARLRDDSRFVLEQVMAAGGRGVVRMPDGRRLPADGANEFIAAMEAHIVDALAKREIAMKRLQELLDQRSTVESAAT